MATHSVMRAIFGRLGFMGEGPQTLTIDQGIYQIDELKDLEDDEVENLLKLLRRPGGTIPNPNENDLGQATHITAPCISVSMRANTHLKLSLYYCRHMIKTSRPVRITDILCPIIRALKGLREEKEKVRETPKYPAIDPKNWLKTLEAVQE